MLRAGDRVTIVLPPQFPGADPVVIRGDVQDMGVLTGDRKSGDGDSATEVVIDTVPPLDTVTESPPPSPT